MYSFTHSRTHTHTHAHTHTHTHTQTCRASCAFETADQNCTFVYTTPEPELMTLNCSDTASKNYFSSNNITVADAVIDCCCTEAASLTSVVGDIQLASSCFVCTGYIASIGGSVSSSGYLGGLAMPSVTYIGGSVTVEDSYVYGLYAASLETVGGTFSLSNNSLTVFVVNALSSVGGNLDLSYNNMDEISFPNNLTVNGYIDLSHNVEGEASFNFSSTVQIDADYIDLTGNSFVYADCTTTGYCLWLPGSYDNTGCDICEA